MQVAVLGAGYAGVRLVRELERHLPSSVDLVLVDDTGEHLVQHELHRLLRYPELGDDIRIPVSELVSTARIITASVERVDPVEREVELNNTPNVTPDILAVCLGAVSADAGVPGVAQHAFPLKRISHADAIRERFQSLSQHDRIIVAGAGLSGIQIAGELATAATATNRQISIHLIEQAESVAPGFPDSFQRAVTDALYDAGVSVRTGLTIKRVSSSGIKLHNGRSVTGEQVIWAGGITGSQALGGRRIPVRADLRVADRTFVLGDAADVTDDRGDRVPPAAQTAIRQAPIAARNIDRLVLSDRADRAYVFEPRMDRYRFHSPGWVVSVGDDAVALVGDTIFRGTPAKTLKASINAGYLGSVGTLNRALDAIADTIG